MISDQKNVDLLAWRQQVQGQAFRNPYQSWRQKQEQAQ